MKAITIYQPWASLIGPAKRIETRSRPISYRGPLAIHAGKTTPAWVWEIVKEDAALRDVLMRTFKHTRFETLPTGVIVATCELANCLIIGQTPMRICTVCKGYLAECGHTNTHTEQGVPPIKGVEQEYLLGDFSPGRHAWMLDNIKPLPEPIAATGKQGLWEWER